MITSEGPATGHPVTVDETVEEMLRSGSPVAFGVSGGKDSDAAVLIGNRYLDSIGHPRHKRILIHSDLGAIEWADSLPHCQKLAEFVGLELVVVQREAGGLIERFHSRWSANVRRYVDLECVTLIMPWSSPAMRFCTSELKSAVIASELRRRFAGERIVSVSGIRRQESRNRAKAPVAQANKRLTGVRAGTSGVDWNIIIDMSLDEVLAVHQEFGFPLHPAYDTFGATRVSCSACIMADDRTLRAGFADARNHEALRRLMQLEIVSAFGYQGARWLTDYGRDLLSGSERAAAYRAKRLGARRRKIQAQLPERMLYQKGWPTHVPSVEDAAQLASMRRKIGAMMGLDVDYTDGRAVRDRYAELLAARGPE